MEAPLFHGVFSLFRREGLPAMRLERDGRREGKREKEEKSPLLSNNRDRQDRDLELHGNCHLYFSDSFKSTYSPQGMVQNRWTSSLAQLFPNFFFVKINIKKNCSRTDL